MNVVSRRTIFAAAGVAGIASLSGVSGCGMFTGSAPSGGTGPKSDFTLPTQVPTRLLPGAITSQVDLVPRFYVWEMPTRDVYQQTVEKRPGDGSQVLTTLVRIWGEIPEPIESNLIWQDLNERLGVRLEGIFTNRDTLNDKLSVLLASGDVPDLVLLQDRQPVGRRAIRDGAFADLSETLSGDNIKRWPHLAGRRPEVWEASLHEGRIYGIPTASDPVDGFLTVRADVAERVGVEPQLTDAEAFRTLAVQASRLGSLHGSPLVGLGRYNAVQQKGLETMFRVGPTWQLDEASGAFGHKAFTDAYADSLEFAARLWREGAFHPDAMSPTIPGELNQAAVTWGNFNELMRRWTTRIQDIEKDVDGARVQIIHTPGFDGGEVAFVRAPAYSNLIAISSETAADRSRLELALDVLNYCSAPIGSTENLLFTYGKEGRDWVWNDRNEPEPIEGVDNGTTEVALAAGPADQGLFVSPALADRLPAFQKVLERLTQQSVPDPAATLDSEELTRSGTRLDTLLTEQQNQIVQGRSSVKVLREQLRGAEVDAISEQLATSWAERKSSR